MSDSIYLTSFLSTYIFYTYNFSHLILLSFIKSIYFILNSSLKNVRMTLKHKHTCLLFAYIYYIYEVNIYRKKSIYCRPKQNKLTQKINLVENENKINKKKNAQHKNWVTIKQENESK